MRYAKNFCMPIYNQVQPLQYIVFSLVFLLPENILIYFNNNNNKSKIYSMEEQTNYGIDIV